MNTLVLATRNRGKLTELRRLLEHTGIKLVGMMDLPDLPEVVEDGSTFSANARKKAETIASLTGLPCLADDSGLVVAALDGRPGVHSARFAGAEATAAANNQKLLRALEQVPEGRRQAAFHCVMALAEPGRPTRLFEGRVEGLILASPSGEGGFGYDPLFYLPEQGCSMAQLPLDAKNRISHRGRALQQLLAGLGVKPAAACC